MASTTLLVIITSSILVVSSRCKEEIIDSAVRIKAFKLARDNMEFLLGEATVTEMIEFGSDEENPDIEWEISVEPFTEPITSDMWIRAVSTASYTASSGEREYIEFTHWLTDLTEAQVKQIQEQRLREEEFLNETLVNPYGDDPEGLMLFHESLASDRRFSQAAQIALDLLKQYPDSPEAAEAAEDAANYARKMASFGDYGDAADVVMEIAKLIDDPTIEKRCVDDVFRYSNDAAKAGSYSQAGEIVNKFAEEFPDHKKAESALDHAMAIASLAAKSGHYRDAQNIIDGAKGVDPSINIPDTIPEDLPTLAENDPTPDTSTGSKGNNTSGQDDPMLKFLRGELTFEEAVQALKAGRN